MLLYGMGCVADFTGECVMPDFGSKNIIFTSAVSYTTTVSRDLGILSLFTF
jgi:hypothetical protein